MMQRYKSIFKESGGSLEVRSVTEAKQIVDISDLVWSEDKGKMNWDSAISSCPPGWRLPTVQELYTALKQNVSGFQSDTHWSSTETDKNTFSAYCVNFKSGYVINAVKTDWLYVRYVKEINASYEDKIESLLTQHLKKNYSKSPKEIEAIEYFISSVLDDLEYTEFTMAEASKMLMMCKRFLGVI